MSLHFNVFDQATLTEVINRPLIKRVESDPSVGETIAPLNQVQSREVKLQVRDVEAFGKGQFRAPGATPALTEFRSNLREEVIELALLDEMNRIKDEDYLALSSPDDNQKRKAGVSIVDRGTMLAIRNQRLTDTMRWQSFSGSCTITYPNGGEIDVDYGIPNVNKPTASTAWSDKTNSDPIADLRAWQKLSANQIGTYGVKIHMNSDTFLLVLENAKLKDYLTGWGRPLFFPQNQDILDLLRGHPSGPSSNQEATEIIIVDGGYRAEGVGSDRGVGNVTRFLPYGKVLITTEYSVDGQRIADVCDGQVIVSTGYNQVGIRQGSQAEVLLEHFGKTHFLRYASARIPRILQPGAFVYATVAS